MSSNQPPQQAGRFKPRKAATLKGGTSDPTSTSNNNISASVATVSATVSATDAISTVTFESNLKPKATKEASNTLQQARSRNSKGGGRGGKKGSAYSSLPKGQVFFTGTAKSQPSSAHSKTKNVSAAEGTGKDSTGVVLSRFGPYSKTSGNIIGKTAQERMMASAMARRGEGEEVIVGTLDGDHDTSMTTSMDYDSDEQKNIVTSKKKEGDAVSSSPTRNKQHDSKVDDDDYHYHHHHHHMNTNNECDYTYDSDSSQDEQDDNGNTLLYPQRLPFPPPRSIGSSATLEPLYACQTKSDIPFESSTPKVVKETSIHTDPPPKTPFHVLNTQDDKKEEQSSWMLFKFPTRLPRLAPHCITSNSSGKSRMDASNTTISKDTLVEPMNMDQDDDHCHDIVSSSIMSSSNSDANAVPDAIISSSYFNEDSTEINPSVSRNNNHNHNNHHNSSTSSNHMHDNTLKDASAGRYGKIIVHKSGKAYLVVGGSDSKTPQVRMLLQNGLSCGFLQQAVSIRTPIKGVDGEEEEGGSYIPLGEVQKTIVVTPDVESAFC